MSKPAVLTPQDMANRVEYEGIGYAVQQYYGLDVSCPEDPELEAAWKAAYDALTKLETLLTKYQDQ